MKRMTAAEFREQGYLQELNRRFLHPLGLALECIVDDKGETTGFGGVWDFRDDPEGMQFGFEGDDDKQKFIVNATRIQDELDSKGLARIKLFGLAVGQFQEGETIVQPLPPSCGFCSSWDGLKCACDENPENGSPKSYTTLACDLFENA